ncbi:hypothetical protein JCM14469_39050 [Desulfatiferula olefinivorans]
MKVYTYSEARQKLSMILDMARDEDVVIKRRGGETFKVVFSRSDKSPFDVPGMPELKSKINTHDILDAVRESRSMGSNDES